MLEFPPNITFVYQAVLFLALWAVLKRLVFDRFLETIEKRHHHTAGAVEETRRLRAEVERLQADYDGALAEIRREGARAKEEIRRQGESEERALVDAARNEAAEALGQIRSRVAGEVATARATLERETADLSEQVFQSLTGARS